MSKPKQTYGRNYRVPDRVVDWAVAEAWTRCRATGQPWTWSQIVREVLDRAVDEAEKRQGRGADGL